MEDTGQLLDQNFIQTENSDPALNLASTGKRFANMIIDIICYYVIFIVVGILMTVLGLPIDFENKLMVYAILLPVHFLYYSSFEAMFGKTVGKMVTKTSVVDERGNKISFGDAALRSVCRFIPFEGLTFLGSGPGLHDRLSKTRVINDK